MKAVLRASHVLMLLLSLLLLADQAKASAATHAGADTHAIRSESQLEGELHKLLRTFSFNIINLEHGFSISRGTRKVKFAAVRDLPHDIRRYVVSGPEINGFLELKLGEGFFHDVSFMEVAPASAPTGRTIFISRIPVKHFAR